MDTSTLRDTMNELAAWLSELTVGDLQHPLPREAGDLGDLYCRLLDETTRVSRVLGADVEPALQQIPRRAELASLTDTHGGGFERRYRRVADVVERAFAETDPLTETDPLGSTPEVTNDVVALYDSLVTATEAWAEQLASALGFAT